MYTNRHATGRTTKNLATRQCFNVKSKTDNRLASNLNVDTGVALTTILPFFFKIIYLYI